MPHQMRPTRAVRERNQPSQTQGVFVAGLAPTQQQRTSTRRGDAGQTSWPVDGLANRARHPDEPEVVVDEARDLGKNRFDRRAGQPFGIVDEHGQVRPVVPQRDERVHIRRRNSRDARHDGRPAG